MIVLGVTLDVQSSEGGDSAFFVEERLSLSLVPTRGTQTKSYDGP